MDARPLRPNERRAEERIHANQILAQLGSALWLDPDKQVRATTESFAAASLLNIPEELKLERAARALVARAERESASAFARNMDLSSHPFYRLTAPERIALIAGHTAHWSYERLGRVLGVTPEAAEALLWSARVHFCALLNENGKKIPYPASNPQAAMTCPDSPQGRPWFQRMLDEETQSGVEKLFIQNHVIDCKSCHSTWMRAKDFFYALDREMQEIPAFKATALAQRALDETRAVLSYDRDAIGPLFIRSLRTFAARTEVRLVWGVTVAALVWGILRR